MGQGFTLTSFGEVTGLPVAKEGTILVVSGLVASAIGGQRSDVFSPGALIRDDSGRPIGCQGLTQPAAR